MSLTSFHPSVSIVIKTYDNSTTLDHRKPTLKELLVVTLHALAEQTLRPCEIVIVDSSVGDGIAKVIHNHSSGDEVPVRRVTLPPQVFSYPRALNLGLQHAEGDIVVSLSGDATPANAVWLENLVAPLANPAVAGAYSRQITRPDIAVCWAERLRLWWRYHSKCVTLRYSDHLFSNACSAFRKDLTLKTPFDETLVELEDYEWARAMQCQGYTIAYVGDSEVYHSHTSSNLKTLGRMLYYLYLRMRADVH
ncbi:glycosyltransferase family 2 protein [Chloroflexota bacterium]